MKRFIFVLGAVAALYSWAGQSGVVSIECDDLLRFSKQTIRVKAGATVTLELKNTGRIPHMKHNLVILKPGTNLARFGQAAANAADDQYIPSSLKDMVIAHTKLVGAGESAKVSFTAPARGEYAFICSFPGHQAVSNGKLIVE